MFTKLFKSEGGFTLVELLVTISILGVLFGIVTLTLSGVGSDAQDSVCASETHLVQSALDVWMAINPSATAPSLTPAAKINPSGLFGDTSGVCCSFLFHLEQTPSSFVGVAPHESKFAAAMKSHLHLIVGCINAPLAIIAKEDKNKLARE